MKVKQPSAPVEPKKDESKVNGENENVTSDKKVDLHKSSPKSKKKKAKASKKTKELRSPGNSQESKSEAKSEPKNDLKNHLKQDLKNDPKKYIDREKYPLRVKASPYEFDLDKEPQTIDEMLTEIKKLFNNFLIGNVAESKHIFYQRAHLSFFYEICCCGFDFLDSLLRLDKENLEIALNSVTACNNTANKLRKKMSLIGYLIRGDFSQHTDMELYAEAAHSFTQVLNGFIVALLDQVRL